MAFVKDQLLFVDRTVWYSETESVERINEPVLFDHEEDFSVSEHVYTKWWFIDANGSRDYVQGFKDACSLKTVEDVFDFKPEI